MPLALKTAAIRTVTLIVAAAVAAASVVVAAQTKTDRSMQPVHINGAGGTFPYPIYAAWFAEYARTKPDVQINYLSIGSGAGIQQLTDQIVFFSASDAPMTEEELGDAPGRILHLPTVIGAVVPIYNLPDVKGERSEERRVGKEGRCRGARLRKRSNT